MERTKETDQGMFKYKIELTSNIIKSYGNLSLTNEYNENPKSHCFLIFFLKTIFNDFANFDQLKAKDYK